MSPDLLMSKDAAQNATDELFRAEQDKIISDLIEAFGSADWEKAVERLAHIGEPAVELLIDALSDYSGHRFKPSRAALALGKIGSGTAEAALIRALRDEKTQSHSFRAITQALAQIGSESAGNALIEVVEDRGLKGWIRGPAADALSRFRSDRSFKVLVATLEDEEANVRYSAGGALAKIGSSLAWEALLNGLNKDPEFLLNSSVREALAEDQPESAIQTLIDMLKFDSWFVWQSAAEILAKMGNKAEDRLILATESPDVRTRRKAALLLGECDTDKAALSLIRLLEDHDALIQDEAAVALTKMRSSAAIDRLIERLGPASQAVQQQICWILGELKAEVAVEALIRIYDQGDRCLRLWVSDALQKISTPRAMQYLQKKDPLEIKNGRHTYLLYPELLDILPDIPSPFRSSAGIETLIVCTKEAKYTLVPVTVENGKPYIYARSGKGRQLDVDFLDFPALARTGLHADDELKVTKTITGISVSEITDSGRPGRSSGSGFMSSDENIISVLRGDNRLVAAMHLTHPQLARVLFHAVNLVFKHAEVYYDELRPWDDIAYFIYNGKRIYVSIETTKGWQESIFADEIYGGYQISLMRDFDDQEKAFIDEHYSRLSSKQQNELIQKLSQIHTGEMEPYYIMRYGFYEGHTEYRTDPIALAFLFGLRTLEEIENAFPGQLYEVLTAHFK